MLSIGCIYIFWSRPRSLSTPLPVGLAEQHCQHPTTLRLKNAFQPERLESLTKAESIQTEVFNPSIARGTWPCRLEAQLAQPPTDDISSGSARACGMAHRILLNLH